MSVPYLITYDNRSPRNYQPLYALMGRFKAVRLAESVWLADLSLDAITVLRGVIAAIEADDLVAVIQLQRDGHWAANRTSLAASNWLSQHISPAMAA